MPRYNTPGAPQAPKSPPKQKPPQGRPPAPSEVSTGVSSPRKRRQPPPPPVNPEIQSGLPGDGKLTGPPIPALQKLGYFGSIHDINQRVQDITDAFSTKFGHQPSPGLVFDVLRSPVQDVHELFSALPGSSAEAQAHNALGTVPNGPKAKLTSPEDQFLADMKSAAEDGRLAEFEDEHEEVFREYAADTRLHGKITAILSTVPGSAGGPSQIRQAGLAVASGDLRVGPVTELLPLGIAQVSHALVMSPVGIYGLAKAVGLDANDLASGKLPHRTANIGKGMVESVKRDVQHPSENPGFLFLDVLGLAGGAAGAVTRVSRAGAAARAGEGVGATTRALVTRPRGGTYELRWGNVTAHELQSENRAVAFFQRWHFDRRNKKLDLRRNGPDAYPGGTLAVAMPTKAEDLLDGIFNPFRKTFSSETKVGRLRAAANRVELNVAMTAARELDYASGWTSRSARVFRQSTGFALKRGDQKAIQVLSTDVPGGPAAQLAAHKAFHEWAIDSGVGDKAAHQRQLTDLKLATKALKNPSKRLQKAINLTRAVMEDGQRIKIEELGLDPTSAEQRIVFGGAVFRFPGIERVDGGGVASGELVHLERQTPESFYLPFVNRAHSRRRPSEVNFASPRAGQYGIPAPSALPELSHFFTGDSIYAGDYRIDATNLATESYARTVRSSAIVHTHGELWEAGLPTRPTGPQRVFYRPIRDVRQVSDELKGALNPVLDHMPAKKEADILTEKEHKSLLEALYPEVTTLTRDELANVRWVDERLIGDMRQMPPQKTAGKKVAQIINEPIRDLVLYTPHYILNAVGNAGMGLIHQGPLLPINIVRAVYKKSIYGEENARTITALVGEGRAKSFVSPDSTFSPGRNLAAMWSVVTDKFFREGALINELRRHGVTDEASATDFFNNPERRVDRNEAVLRANKAMVQFDNLTWFEKNTLRHYIFVYPWVSRSMVWSVRTMIEHPIQTDVLAHLGKEADESMEKNPIFSQSPEWFKRTGYIPVGWKDGKPKVVNPTSINNFSTLGQMVDVFKAGVKGDPYTRVADMFGPAAQFGVHGVTGKDDFGNDYPGSQWWGAAKEILLNTPEASAFQKHKGQSFQKVPAFDITDRESLVKNEHLLAQKKYATVLGPGYWSGYGNLMSGGLTPKVYDPDAAAARFWARQPWDKRNKHEQSLIRQALMLQSGLLRQGVPKQVSEAVSLAGDRTAAYHHWADEKGRTPTPVERFNIDLQVLQEKNRLNKEDAQHLHELMKKANEPEEVSAVLKALDRHTGAKALSQWDSDVRFVYSFRPHIIQDRLNRLKDEGLIPDSKIPENQKALFEYGRQMLSFRKELKKKIEASRAEHLTAKEKSLAMADIRDWQDAHDKPVKIGPHTLPSPVRMEWSLLTPESRQAAISSNTTASWKSLSAFDKELVGRKVDPRVTKGWAALQSLLQSVTAKMPIGERSLASNQKAAAARYIEKYGDNGNPIPGFVKDWEFAQRPLYKRLQVLKPILQSPNRKVWHEVLSTAEKAYKLKKSQGSDRIHDAWGDYVKTSFFPYLQQEHPEFVKELSLYGSNPEDFLNRLVSG